MARQNQVLVQMTGLVGHRLGMTLMRGKGDGKVDVMGEVLGEICREVCRREKKEKHGKSERRGREK